MPHGTWAFQKRKGRSMSGLFQCGRCERIRTSDPFVPNEVRYQAALHTDVCGARIYRKPRHDTSFFCICRKKRALRSIIQRFMAIKGAGLIPVLGYAFGGS